MQRKTLAELKSGEKGRVYALSEGDGAAKRRLTDMGLTPGTELTVTRLAPMGDPMELYVRGYALSLRHADARRVLLLRPNETPYVPAYAFKNEEAAKTPFPYERVVSGAITKIALVGNPNSGKSTLFNALTSSRAPVGNRPGVTVEKKEGKLKRADATVVDLPGVYALSPFSPEERAARDFLLDEEPSVLLNIVDATNMERGLYLTLQLLELGRPVLVALNMMDEVEKGGGFVDVAALSKALGVRVFPISARTGKGLTPLIAALSEKPKAAKVELPSYVAGTERALSRLADIIRPYAKSAGLSLRFASVKLLEGDALIEEALKLPAAAARETGDIAQNHALLSPSGDGHAAIASARYGFIEKLARAAVKRAPARAQKNATYKIDALLMHRFLAFPLFLCVMLLIFLLTFSTAGAWLGDGAGLLLNDVLSPLVTRALKSAGASAWLTSLVSEGLLRGVGSVLSFLPQIAMLFLCLSLLEDSGYMSRIAFLMDRPMRRLGLSGKSFLPLLMGFGCTVPAAMGTRTIENEKARRATLLLLPFMSCSAKLPVYGLLAAAFFPKSGAFTVFFLYALGIFLAVLTGFLMKSLAKKSYEAPFLMELPPYRLPALKSTLLHVGERVWHFLSRAATIIFLMSMGLWFLQSFDFSLTPVPPARSMLALMGGFLAPLFRPLGFYAWQAAVALLTGLVAKEAVVASLALFYGFSAASGGESVRLSLASTFTPRAALSFLVFVLLYPPCAAALVSLRRELKSRRLFALSFAFQMGVAYLTALFIYQFSGYFLGG